MKIKHILITTDLSEEALRPFGPVMQMAKDLGAKVTLLHVVQEFLATPRGAALAPPVSSPDTPQHMEEARKALADQCAGLDGSVSVTPAVISAADIALAVVEYGEKNDANLIAISTHGRTGWKHLLLGSVAESILQHSDIPVLSFHRTK
jgi:nucleotide-binding universal stress UspA family protein